MYGMAINTSSFFFFKIELKQNDITFPQHWNFWFISILWLLIFDLKVIIDHCHAGKASEEYACRETLRVVKATKIKSVE